MEYKSVIIMSSVRWYNASAHYAFYLAQSLKKAGLKVFIFGIPGSPIIIKAKQQGIDVLDEIGISKAGLYKYIKNIFTFRKIFKKHRFDIINPHVSRDHIFAFLALIGKNAKIIRTRTDSITPKNNFFNKFFYRISSSHYVVSSKYMVSHIKAMNPHVNNISVIPLDINYRDFSSYKSDKNFKNELDIKENRIVVSFIGRLDSVKGVDYFIRSFEYLKNKNKFHYIISGEEINLTMNYLKGIASDLKIKNISFISKNEEVREILSITDIGVIPSIGSESICRIGLEMLSFGIPIIGSDINSIPELISEYEGIVVSPGSPQEIAAALDHLADPKNYYKIKNNILSKLKKRNPDRFAIEYMDIFSKVFQN